MMCVYSMIADHYIEKWEPLVPSSPPYPQIPYTDVQEFYTLLKRAREYDRRTGQKDCESESKKDLLRKLAKELGVELKFPDEENEEDV